MISTLSVNMYAGKPNSQLLISDGIAEINPNNSRLVTFRLVNASGENYTNISATTNDNKNCYVTDFKSENGAIYITVRAPELSLIHI